MSSWIVFLARLLSPDFRQLSRETDRVQLISISFSHYCELARWALDWCGVAYDEYGAAPLQHVFPALSIRIGQQETHLSTSSRTTEVAMPGLSPEELDSKKKRDEKKDRSARAAAVPVAVAPDGTIWLDSWDIAERSGMRGIDPQLKLLLDHDIGPLTRQVAYYYVLKESNSEVWNALCTANRHWIWRLLWWLGLNGFLKRRLLGVMKADNPETFRVCKEQLVRAMARLDEIVDARAKQRHVDLIPPADSIGKLIEPQSTISVSLRRAFKTNKLFHRSRRSSDSVSGCPAYQSSTILQRNVWCRLRSADAAGQRHEARSAALAGQHFGQVRHGPVPELQEAILT
jgi:hypothetical protein